jgi:hypothetical protein
MKWGGLKYRRDSLQKSDYLQLAVYGSLCRQQSKHWPTLAYFIIQDARLLVPDSDFFPGADKIVPSNEEDVAAFWHRAEVTWSWRRSQIDKGLIEVPVGNTQPTEDSSPGDDALPVPDRYDQFNDFKVLTGWDPMS